MSHAIALRTVARTDWFESWFDTPYYHALYRRHDDGEAARFVAALVERLGPPRGARMLDLGCGAGRHARQLAALGFRVTGIDLSANSLREAKRFEGPMLRFQRRDMREPFGAGEYDYLFSFFTSFGYFDGAAENLRVVANMANALRPGGRLVLDYLNVRPAQENLVPVETRIVDGVRYRLTRWTDVESFHKRIVVHDPALSAPLEHVERVAKLGLEDFRSLFARNGLGVVDVWGDYALSAYDAARSPRLIVLAEKPLTPASSSSRWTVARG